ncbi:MAG: HD domain-containing protein [Candidatus Dormibacteraeota bacterium]|nr:HD domain-containing protein [Candidatus Dormibacteraeota bacterium]
MADPVVRRLNVTDDPAFGVLRIVASESDGEIWVVGGYVRDRLLSPDGPGSDRDLDLVVVGAPAGAVAARFAQLAEAPPPATFPRFGTAQVTWEGRLFEFVRARRESYSADSRKPDVEQATLEEDLARRDFTINTLYCDLGGGVRDPLGGLADLEGHLLRTPTDPELTFRDDPLRMLRGVRFAAALGFHLAPAAARAMEALAGRLQPPVVSIERIAGEFWKMLVSPRPRLALELLDRHRLLPQVLPELAATHGVVQGGYHDDDVFSHTVRTVELTRPELTLRLAALFHDLGKPATARDGGFPGHEAVGAGLATDALTRLRLPGAQVQAVARLVRLHLRPVFYESGWTDGAVRRLARAAGEDIWLLLELARADMGASTYPQTEKIDELQARLEALLAERPDRFTLPLTGEDIMAALALPPGPEVGRVKAELEDLVLDGILPPDREALLRHLERRSQVS